MIYLIGQLSLWLLLTAGFAALAGWALAAQRAAASERAFQRERNGLVRDLAKLAGGEVSIDTTGAEREADAMRRLIEVRDSRIAELERIHAQERARADEAAARIAELERAPAEAALEVAPQALLAAPTPDPEQEQERALQAWRLRYFEQRVKYLEDHAPPPPARVVEIVREPAPPVEAWRAREAEARAEYLANELRALSAPASAAEPAPEVEAFAADSSVDMLVRWRTLYLERRAEHMQARADAAEQELEPLRAIAERADRWKWRTRYLEARVRHLEDCAPVAAQSQAEAAPAPQPLAAAPQPQPPRRAKPAVLQAPRHGAPDDFTLIEGVSTLQQSTLYSLGVFHFDQIAAWTAENVAWVDQYLRLNGRIDDEEWVEQAADLVREGVAAARREREVEDA